MKIGKGIKKSTKKIIAASAVAVFNVLALTLGVVAWFQAVRNSDVGSNDFEVVGVTGASLASVKLYKFEYAPTKIGSYVDYDHLDYEHPRAEGAGVYCYNFSEERSSFGYLDDDENWQSVSAMNLFDPVEFLINPNTKLIDLNCGVVYEIKCNSANLTNCLINVVSTLKDKTATPSQIPLSNCIEFHAYYGEDLEELTDKSLYYPTKYIATSETLTEEEELYYKLAYLFSKDTNVHFYGSEDDSITIDNSTDVEFNNGEFTFYIFANYAASQLQGYHTDKRLPDNILAVYDFSFSVTFTSIAS